MCKAACSASYDTMDPEERRDFLQFVHSVLVPRGLPQLLKTPGVLGDEQRWIPVDQYGGPEQPQFEDWLRWTISTSNTALLAIGRVLERSKSTYPWLYDAVTTHRFAPLFGLSRQVAPLQTSQPAAPPPAPPSQGEIVDARQYLRQQLNPRFVGWSDQRKDARIDSVLQGPLNDALREHAPWLRGKMYDLLQNGDAHWAPLIVALVALAERRAGSDAATFAVADPRAAVQAAAAVLERSVPLEELALFDATLSRADHRAAWIAAAPSVIGQAELAEWLGEEDVATQTLSPQERALLFADLMLLLRGDAALRKTALRAVASKVAALPAPQRWAVVVPEDLVKQLFPAPAAAAPSNDWSFTAPQPTTWTAKSFLADLGIANAQVEAFLADFDGKNVGLLKQASADDLLAELRQHGAGFKQALMIKNAMIEQHLI